MSRVWLTILALLPLWARAAEGPSKPGADGLRRLHVPFEEVKRILAGSPNAVLLPQASYEAMVKAAELRSRSSNPPQSTVLGSAECEIELRGREASFTATLKIASLAAGVHAVPLRTDGIDLLAASADGKPAALWRDGGQLYVLVDGAGDHVVTLAGLLPVDTDAARQTLHFALPEATATRLRLRAPGDVEVKAGAAELRREYVVAEDRTHLELVPTRQAMDVVLSRNNRQRQSDAVVDAHSVVLVGVGEQGDDMFATVSLDIPHGSIRQARFSLPTAVSITSVEGDDVAQWSTDETELEVVFRGDVTGGTELRIVGLRTGRGLEDWRLPVPQPLDVQSNSAVYGLLLDDRLETRGIQTSGLMPVQAPAEMARRLGVVGGNARPVAFYYAPQGSVDARVRIVKPEAAFRVGGNQLLTLADAGASLLASFVVSPEYERVFWVDVLLPRDWQVEQVVAGGSQLPIEMRAMGEANRLRVTFPEGAKLGAETGFSVQARWVPTDWLGAWDRREVSFPDVRIAGAREETGVLAVVGKDDFEVVPKAPQGLVPLDQQERARYGLQNVESRAIFRYEAPGYALGVDVVRKMPRLRGESLSFFVVGEDHLRAHYELLYQVDRARVRQLQFALPGNTPTALSVSGIGQTPVKEYSSTDQDGRRLWTVWLASPMAGAVRLGVDLQMMTPREGEADLPLPVLVGVDYQSGRLAVEGEEDLDVRVVAHPRPVDVGELAEASNYRPGARLLGTYGFVGDPEPVRVSRTRHGGYALPSVLVVRSELTSVFGTEGRGQHAAQYVLRSKLRFLDMAMPEGASLWSVLVDGTPIAPAKQDDRLLFELPENGGSAEHSLMVVYETEGSRVGMRGELSAVAPSLVLRSDDGYSVPVPVADLEWHVHLPVGFRISGTDGTVAPTQLVPVTPAALNLGLLLYRMTGGVSPQRGLVSGFLLGGLQSARQKAVESSKTAEADKRDLDRLMAEDDTLAADVPVQKPQSAPAPTPSRPTVEQGQMLGYVDSYSRDPKDAASSSWASGWSLPALKGSRSLKIALAGGEDGYLFRSLGEHPRLVVRVLNQRRLDGICRAVAVLVFCVGLLLTRKPFRRKLAYVGGVLVVAGLLPALPGLVGLALLLNSAFYAAALLVPYYVFAWLVRVVVARIGEYVVLETRAASALLVVGLLLGIDALGAPRPDAMEIVKPEPIVLPRDAIVVPYGEDGKPLPDIVVPREHFEALLQSSEPAPDPKAEKPYGVAGGTYTCVLTDTDRLQVHGKMSIEVNGDESVFVPLALRNAVFESVQLDGKPAALAFLGGNDMEVKQIAAPAESFAPVPGIVVAGKGRHELALVLWLPVGSEGGRQRVDSRLPTSGASEVRVRVPTAGVEVFRNLNQRWSSDVSQRAGEEFAAPLGRDGSFRLHWRPKTAETVLDPTLTAESTIEFGIFEDQVRVEWQVRLSFRRGERDVFTFHVPGEYVVEKVAGDNVRGWQVASAADGQTVTVTALKAAAKSESFALSLRRKGLGSMARNERVAFPALVAEGAVRHTAKLVVRHSGLQEIRVAEAAASVRRTEMVAKPKTAVPSDSRPLPVRDYAAYELASLPCTLVFEVSATASRPTVLVRSIVRLSRRQRVVESRIEVSRVLRPLYEMRISVPPELEVKDVRSAVRAEWYLQGEGEGRTLTVLLPDGVQGTVALGLDGQLPGGLGDVALPRIEVLGMPEQKGEIVVQADPGLQVDPVSEQGLEQVMLQFVHPWLNPAQQALARLAYRHGAEAFQGVVRVSRKPTEITAETIGNVRVTDRMVEETSLITFQVQGVGARELRFRRPVAQATAEIECPLLREKTVTVSGDEALVRLVLQDEVVGEIKVLVRQDAVRSEKEIVAIPPVIDTGRTIRRILVAESAGSDEVVVDTEASVGLEPLKRQSWHWSAVAHLLGEGAGQAFLVKGSAAAPRMVLRVERRESVATAGARIGLARTVLMVDDSGAFRGIQNFYVDNRTEPYLEIELPAGASLWTARVSNQLVKPVRIEGHMPGRVSIPLVKTAEGDLDYQVVLKYGGTTDLPSLGGKMSFPVIRPLNVTPERSQLELRLPRRRQWLQFGGSMGVVGSREEFQAGYLAYQNLQAKRLLQAMQSSSDYVQRRAESNMRQLKGKIALDISGVDSSEKVAKERRKVEETLALGEQRLVENALRAASVDNSVAFRESYAQQGAKMADKEALGRYNWDFKDSDGLAEAKPEREAGARKKATGDWRKIQNRALVVQNDASGERDVAEVQSQLEKSKAGKPADFGMRMGGQYASEPSQAHVLGLDLADVGGTVNVYFSELPDQGLASLDVAFPDDDPERWETVRLATPRGDMEVTARALNRSIVVSLQRLGLCLLAFAGLLVPVGLFLLLKRAGRRDTTSVGKWLFVAGLVSVFFGILPVVGVLLWMGAVVVTIARHLHRPVYAMRP